MFLIATPQRVLVRTSHSGHTVTMVLVHSLSRPHCLAESLLSPQIPERYIALVALVRLHRSNNNTRQYIIKLCQNTNEVCSGSRTCRHGRHLQFVEGKKDELDLPHRASKTSVVLTWSAQCTEHDKTATAARQVGHDTSEMCVSTPTPMVSRFTMRTLSATSRYPADSCDRPPCVIPPRSQPAAPLHP
jgi:hypothetical protein